MNLTDPLFLFLFLPAAWLLWFVAMGARPWIALLISLFFYGCVSPRYVLLLMVWMCANIVLDLIQVRVSAHEGNKAFSRVILALTVVGNLAVLTTYKYTDLTSLALPVGLSYFSFKAISLAADIYKGQVTSLRIVDVAVYLSFFGQIEAGPLARYSDFKLQKFDLDRTLDGLTRFLIGMCKKVLLADVLIKPTSEIFAMEASKRSGSIAWAGVLFASLVIYYDFSGYSDMAIGLTQLFGYKCPENFRYPYLTPSVSEFWRRWHITLGSWFKDYIYFPLGGSRVSKWRLVLNILAVWLATGIWHGKTACFIVWGLMNFCMVLIEKFTGLPGKNKKSAAAVVWRIVTLIFIGLSWVVFYTASLGGTLMEAGAYFGNLLFTTGNHVADLHAAFLIRDNLAFLAAAILFCFPVYPYLEKKTEEGGAVALLIRILGAAALVGLVMLSVSLIITGESNPFAYANF